MSQIARRLGVRIRELRQNLGRTQEEVANRAGISTSFLSMIEHGERQPGIRFAYVADPDGHVIEL